MSTHICMSTHTPTHMYMRMQRGAPSAAHAADMRTHLELQALLPVLRLQLGHTRARSVRGALQRGRLLRMLPRAALVHGSAVSQAPPQRLLHRPRQFCAQSGASVRSCVHMCVCVCVCACVFASERTCACVCVYLSRGSAGTCSAFVRSAHTSADAHTHSQQGCPPGGMGRTQHCMGVRTQTHTPMIGHAQSACLGPDVQRHAPPLCRGPVQASSGSGSSSSGGSGSA